MSRVTERRASQAGFSLIEVMITVAIAGIVTSMAVVQIAGSRAGAVGDGGLRVVLSQLNAAREMAITQRRNMRVTFTLGNKVEIQREESPGPTLTTLSSVLMESGLLFTTVTNLPDTPDHFYCPSCTVLPAVSFPTATGSPLEVKFKPDGTFVNQDGNTLNGTVFVALPNQTYATGPSSGRALSARAVTVLGSTGRVRGYRFDGRNWKPV
jgi:prepilin-type N-terminal cleavage/methylation domain-containing protein